MIRNVVMPPGVAFSFQISNRILFIEGKKVMVMKRDPPLRKKSGDKKNKSIHS